MPTLERWVLVVEDEPALLEVIAGFLRHLGWNPLLASCGAEAERLSRRHFGQIDLLLADLELPDRLGTKVAESICAARPETKVLFMTAGGLWCNPAKYGLPAPYPLLEKPFGLSEFRQKVEMVLDSSE